MPWKMTKTTKIQVYEECTYMWHNILKICYTFTGDNIINEVSIVSDGENSSEEESEDEETAGKVVTKAGVEVYS